MGVSQALLLRKPFGITVPQGENLPTFAPSGSPTQDDLATKFNNIHAQKYPQKFF